MRIRGYGAKLPSHFSKLLHKSFGLKQIIMIVYDSIQNVANVPEISQYFMEYYLDFIQL
jgi:hypothetical protein